MDGLTEKCLLLIWSSETVWQTMNSLRLCQWHSVGLSGEATPDLKEPVNMFYITEQLNIFCYFKILCTNRLPTVYTLELIV